MDDVYELLNSLDAPAFDDGSAPEAPKAGAGAEAAPVAPDELKATLRVDDDWPTPVEDPAAPAPTCPAPTSDPAPVAPERRDAAMAAPLRPRVDSLDHYGEQQGGMSRMATMQDWRRYSRGGGYQYDTRQIDTTLSLYSPEGGGEN